jgi:hypothetical protein
MIPTIGFDFDSCITNAYSITPFVILLETLIPRAISRKLSLQDEAFYLEKSRTLFYETIAHNEHITKGTLFRPSILRLLPKLLDLKKHGKLNSLFIYSNNEMAELIHVVDHILALTLMKEPYNVSEENLIHDVDGLLHTLTPRIHLDAPCRQMEIKDSKGFREKSLEGINACLTMPVSESELWYLDDTRDHTRLMNQIKEKYVVVEPYSVQLSNKKIAEMFIESYPHDAFKSNTPVGKLLLDEINRLMPGFHPTGNESRERLVEKFVKVLNAFSPESGGHVFSRWNEEHSSKDYLLIEKGLDGSIKPVEVLRNKMNKPLMYSETRLTGGSRYKKTRRSSKRSLKNKHRKK